MDTQNINKKILPWPAYLTKNLGGEENGMGKERGRAGSEAEPGHPILSQPLLGWGGYEWRENLGLKTAEMDYSTDLHLPHFY